MKSLLYFSLLIFSNFSWGQTCPGASKEMTDYLAQATWKASRVSDPKVAPVDGFTNSAGQFLFGDLTRGGKYEAELKVSPTNRSFTKYCRDRKRYGSYLSSMRWERENNEYRIRVQYLPSIDGQAFKTQGFKVSRSDVRVEMGRDSIVVNEEYDSSSIRQEIQNRISKQLAQQKDVGVFNLDLSGYDDFVCDLVHGNSTITIEQIASSKAPVVIRELVIEPRDIETAFEALKRSPRFESNFRRTSHAMKVWQELEDSGGIAQYEESVMLKVLDLFYTEKEFINWDRDALLCIGNKLQEYRRETIQHSISVTPRIDFNLNPESAE